MVEHTLFMGLALATEYFLLFVKRFIKGGILSGFISVVTLGETFQALEIDDEIYNGDEGKMKGQKSRYGLYNTIINTLPPENVPCSLQDSNLRLLRYE